jgi:hypothetical protein
MLPTCSASAARRRATVVIMPGVLSKPAAPAYAVTPMSSKSRDAWRKSFGLAKPKPRALRLRLGSATADEPSAPRSRTTWARLSEPIFGFKVAYSNGNDHHLGLLDVEIAIQPGGISGSNVSVNLTYGLRDWSGNWDDTYEGILSFTVVGE